MRATKRFLKHTATQSALAFLLSLYIRLVVLTSRVVYIIDPQAEPYLHGEQNAIFAFWHGRMMVLPCFHPPHRQMHVLISFHRDGRLISQVIGHFKEKTITGSTSRGGAEAVRHIVRLLKNGDNISITPDGPRGPAQVAEMGVATIARLAKKPVLPVTFYASRHKRLRSWDSFMVALPFSRIVFCVGAPVVIETVDENSRLAIETTMNALVEKADAL